MWGFGLMFWLVVCMFFAVVARRRRWERWAMMGRPRGYPVYPGWWDSREWRTPRREPATRRHRGHADREGHVEDRADGQGESSRTPSARRSDRVDAAPRAALRVHRCDRPCRQGGRGRPSPEERIGRRPALHPQEPRQEEDDCPRQQDAADEEEQIPDREHAVGVREEEDRHVRRARGIEVRA